jgi:hypothetical protein
MNDSLHGIGDMPNRSKLNAMLLLMVVLDVLRVVRWALHLHCSVDIEDLFVENCQFKLSSDPSTLRPIVFAYHH